MACYQEALRLDPNLALAKNNLARALKAKAEREGPSAPPRDAKRP